MRHHYTCLCYFSVVFWAVGWVPTATIAYRLDNTYFKSLVVFRLRDCCLFCQSCDAGSQRSIGWGRLFLLLPDIWMPFAVLSASVCIMVGKLTQILLERIGFLSGEHPFKFVCIRKSYLFDSSVNTIFLRI